MIEPYYDSNLKQFFLMVASNRYLAMELCASSLDRVFLAENDRKKYRGPLPNEVDFMLQLASGLNYIHSQNIVHRDVKPSNILISVLNDEQAVMKWTDFGLSKTTTKDGTFSMSGLKGTKCFWAPEVFIIIKEKDHSIETNKRDDGKIKMTIMGDIFACGCVFFQFLTNPKGIHPFGGNNEEEITRNLQQSNPTNLQSIILFIITYYNEARNWIIFLIIFRVVVQSFCLQYYKENAGNRSRAALKTEGEHSTAHFPP